MKVSSRLLSIGSAVHNFAGQSKVFLCMRTTDWHTIESKPVMMKQRESVLERVHFREQIRTCIADRGHGVQVVKGIDGTTFIGHRCHYIFPRSLIFFSRDFQQSLHEREWVVLECRVLVAHAQKHKRQLHDCFQVRKHLYEFMWPRML